MGTNQPNQPPASGKPANAPPPRRIDDRTVALTEAEINAFGSQGGDAVRGSGKVSDKKPDAKSK